MAGLMYLVFAHMPSEGYCRWLRSLFLCLCEVFLNTKSVHIFLLTLMQEELQKLVKSEHERIDKENSSKGEAPTSAADASSTDNSASSAGDGTSPASKSPEQKL